MAELKDTKTHENLKEAFAGESQANRRYLYFAKIADVEGYPEVAGNFRETAEGVLSWMYDTLHDPTTRAFKGSQDANPEYAHLTTKAARQEFGKPACDPTIFTNWKPSGRRRKKKSASCLLMRFYPKPDLKSIFRISGHIPLKLRRERPAIRSGWTCSGDRRTMSVTKWSNAMTGPSWKRAQILSGS